MKELEYKIDIMYETKDLYREMAKSLRMISISTGAIKTDMEACWNSDAGKQFLSSLDMSWIPALNHYADVLDHMNSLLDLAIDNYEQISGKADSVYID